MSDERAVVDPEEEREVDLRSAWRRIADRWWLPVVGLVVGAVLGVIVALGGGDTYEARALVYLGQPFTPGAGGQIQSLATNPKTVSEIIRSEAALVQAAKDSGLRVSQLRGNVTSSAITSPGQARNQSALVEILVQAPERRKAADAANSLAGRVAEQVSEYVLDKVRILERSVIQNQKELDAADARIQFALAQQRLAVTSKELELAERLLIQSNANATLTFYEARQSNLRANLNSNQQLLSLARNVEMSRVVEEARGVATEATSRRNAALVGAILGLLAGALVALLWDPVARRRAAPA